mgnify:CR=1 FL=1
MVLGRKEDGGKALEPGVTGIAAPSLRGCREERGGIFFGAMVLNLSVRLDERGSAGFAKSLKSRGWAKARMTFGAIRPGDRC